MQELLERGYKAKLRPSGHDISTKFSRDNGGAIPPNLLKIANTESNSKYLRACRQFGLKPHPARYPAGVPEFFIKFLTEPDDLVLDPFAGSNVTGEVAEKLNRRWIAFEIVEEYLKGSYFRFEEFVHPKAEEMVMENGLPNKKRMIIYFCINEFLNSAWNGGLSMNKKYFDKNTGIITYQLSHPHIAKYLVIVVDSGMTSEINYFTSLKEAKRAFNEIAHDYDKYDVSIWKWIEERYQKINYYN